MLTYTPNPPTTATPAGNARPWLLMLLTFIWLWPGVFSHDLWTASESQIYTIVEQWQPNQWAVPQLFGQVDWETSPLYIWLAVLSRHYLSPWLVDGYEAVRLVNVLLMALGFACIGGAARQFLGRRTGRTAVLILIGCPGLLIPGHLMGSISVLFTGCAMCWYGWSLSKTRVIMASLMLGGGWVVLSLTNSLLTALTGMLLALVLLWHPQWRHRRYRLVVIIALLWAWPLMAIWPFALHQTNPAWFHQWWQMQVLFPFGGFTLFRTDFSLPYYLKNTLWFAFPAWPLALWTIYNTRIHHSDWGILGLAWLGCAMLLLTFSPIQFQDLLVIILPPLTLIASVQLDALRRGAVAFLNWFGIMTFGFLALFLWLGFVAMNYGWPPKLAERALYFSPYYQTDIDYFPLLVAGILTPLWLWAITRQHVRGRQAVTNWTAGIVLVWSLLLTLFLPWLDAAKSMRVVVQQMQHSLNPAQTAALVSHQACVRVDSDNQAVRIAWQQYGWIPLAVDNTQCRYYLTTRAPEDSVPAGWQEIWTGARPREKHHILALWQRQDTPSAQQSSRSTPNHEQ